MLNFMQGLFCVIIILFIEPICSPSYAISIPTIRFYNLTQLDLICIISIITMPNIGHTLKSVVEACNFLQMYLVGYFFISRWELCQFCIFQVNFRDRNQVKQRTWKYTFNFKEALFCVTLQRFYNVSLTPYILQQSVLSDVDNLT